MSYDPYASDPNSPSEYDESAAPIPRHLESINGRVRPPAIALIVVGILNLLGACFGFLNVALTASTPANELHQRLLDVYQAFPALQDELKKRSPDELKNETVLIYGGAGGVSLVLSVLVIISGIRMLSLKNYALAVCGAVCTAIPCLSCGGCCLVGQAIGIWALIVLLNPEVRAAFQQRPGSRTVPPRE
jgi:hypothetical protein